MDLLCKGPRLSPIKYGTERDNYLKKVSRFIRGEGTHDKKEGDYVGCGFNRVCDRDESALCEQGQNF